MTDPDMNPEGHGRNEKALWVLMGLMALVVVGGLAYGLSYPSIYARNAVQTTGPVAAHARPGHPL